MEIKLSPNFEVDIYNKQVKSKATLYLPKGKKDYSVELEIFQKNNNHRLAKISKTSIEEDDKKLVAPLTISEKHLSDRKLETKIVVVLYKKEEYSYTTGALFWTKVHTANVDKEVERKELEMWVNYFNSNRK